MPSQYYVESNIILSPESQVLLSVLVCGWLGFTVYLLWANHTLRVYKAKTAQFIKENQEVAKILIKRDLELTQANSRLEDLDLVKSEFVSVAAHQLRTPLTGVRWSLRGLLDGEYGSLSAEQKRIIQNAQRAIIISIELINDLLQIARIEGGRFGFTFQVQPLRPLFDALVERCRPRAQGKGITFTATIPTDLSLAAFDAEKLDMALENVLDNAIKYTLPSGTVRFAAITHEDKIEITVEDTGIGIPRGEQYRIFTKFFRAPNAVLLETNGTGLGLYLVKNIIDKHHGTIRIVSEEGKGTKVNITLPLHLDSLTTHTRV